MRIAIFLVSALALLPSAAMACSPAIDQPVLTLQERADKAGQVFIGKVVAVSSEDVEFLVKSGEDEKSVHIKPVNNTCGIMFSVGEVWLYLGPLGFDGTQRLEESDIGADPQAVIKRLMQ